MLCHHIAQSKKRIMRNVLHSPYQISEGRHVSSASCSQFDCGADVYVDPKQVCDFTPDCPHGEDEANCRKCSLIMYSVHQNTITPLNKH